MMDSINTHALVATDEPSNDLENQSAEQNFIFESLNGNYEFLNHLQNFAAHIKPEYRHELTTLSITGNPNRSFFAGLNNCFTSIFLYPLGSEITRNFKNLTPTQSRALTSAPLLLGGLARILSGWLTDKGYGKEAMLGLQVLSLASVIGVITLLHTHSEQEFSEATINSKIYWEAWLCNVMQVAIGGYSAGMALTARQTRHDAEHWENDLHQMFIQLNITDFKLNYFHKKLGHTIRQGHNRVMAITSAISNTAPGIALIILATMRSKYNSILIYYVFAGIMSLLTLRTYFSTSNTIRDQLGRQGVPQEKASEIATYMGQLSPPAPAHYFSGWTNVERQEIIDSCVYYSIIYGLLVSMCSIGPDTLKAQGMNEFLAGMLIAAVAIISSFFRGVPAYYSLGLTPRAWINLSLTGMLISSIIVQVSPKQATWALMVFAMFNGTGNFAVVERISNKIPAKIGIATSLSTGLAAFLAFPIGISSTWFAYTPTLLCSTGLTYAVVTRRKSLLRQLSVFSERPRQLEMANIATTDNANITTPEVNHNTPTTSSLTL